MTGASFRSLAGTCLRVATSVMTVSALSAVLVAASTGTASASPGALNTSFGTAGKVVDAGSNGITGEAVVPNGVAAAGDIVTAGSAGNRDFQVGRFSARGALDGSFNGGFVDPFAGQALAVAVIPFGDPDAGDVVAVGYWITTSDEFCEDQPTPVVAEFTPSGVLNTSFGSGGRTVITAGVCSFGESRLSAVTVESGGRIVVAGQSTNAGATIQTLVARLTSTGALDTSFDGTGYDLKAIGNGNSAAYGVAIDATNGDIVTGGFSENGSAQSLSTVAAFFSSGGSDGTLSWTATATGGDAPGSVAAAVTALPDGNVVAAGSTLLLNTGTPRFFLAQYTSNGATDTAFGGGTGQVIDAPATNAQEVLSAVSYEPYGGVLVAAGAVGPLKSQTMVVTQYNAVTGAVNGAFGPLGGAAVQSFPYGPSSAAAVVELADGEMIVAGAAPSVDGVEGAGLARLYGPTIVMPNLGIIQVHADGPITINFPIIVSEPLFTSIPAVFCAASGGIVDFQSGCGTVNIPAGTTRLNVPLTIDITNGAGNQQTVVLVVASADGVTGDPAALLGLVVVQHLPPLQPYVGYRLVASDGGIFDFGTAPFLGSEGGKPLTRPIVGIAANPDGAGYWMVASDGGIFAFGVGFYGSEGGKPLAKPIVGMASTPDGRGYWMVASDGGIFTFGDAHFHGSEGGKPLSQPIVGMAATPDGGGYYLVARDGGIFTFGDARFLGSEGGKPLSAPIVGMATDPAAPGYWMVASDGGIFTFGDAPFHGSEGGKPLTKPIVGMAAAPNGQGYWFVASDGGIFSFNAPFYGSEGGKPLAKPIVGMAS